MQERLSAATFDDHLVQHRWAGKGTPSPMEFLLNFFLSRFHSATILRSVGAFKIFWIIWGAPGQKSLRTTGLEQLEHPTRTKRQSEVWPVPPLTPWFPIYISLFSVWNCYSENRGPWNFPVMKFFPTELSQTSLFFVDISWNWIIYVLKDGFSLLRIRT